jgi:hypothetical protein
MIFEPDNPIDDNVVDLVRQFKKSIDKDPSVRWIEDRSTWVIGSETWISEPVYISYHYIDKKKFELFTAGQVIGSFVTAKEAIHAMTFLKFSDQGVSGELIRYLMVKTRTCSMQEAVDSIAIETELMITPEEMRILKIDDNQFGRIVGMSYGI